MIPPSIQPIIIEFVHKLLKNSDDNVLSIVVYGSAAGPAIGGSGPAIGGSGVNYNHGVSNINIAVIVKNLDFSVLNQSVILVKWGHKHKISTPLFLTKEYIF